jgi:chaperonin GroES
MGAGSEIVKTEAIFRTLHDRVLVKSDKPQAMIGLIHIPDSAQIPPVEGEVIAAGRGVDSPLDVKAGDRICFVRSAGKTVKIDDEERLLLEEFDIHGVLENGTLRPIGNKVLLLPDPPDEKIGRIEIPKSYQKDLQKREALVSGRIVAMGPGMRMKGGKRWPMPDVKIGQRVLYFHNYSPEITLNGEAHVVVADDQLRAAIEED